MEENLYKKQRNKKAIDSLAVTISSEDRDSNNNNNEITELEAHIDF